jgi:hypothetical protein
MRISMGEPHEHWRTACTYGGVNGVTFRLVAQSFALSLLRPLCESRCFTANSVFFRRSGSPPSSPDGLLDLVRSRNRLTLA